jgi:TP901 family phage tail tape measure protein
MAKINKVISIKVEGVRRIKELEDSLKKLRKEQRDNKKQSEGDANRYSKTAKAIKEQSTELRGLRKQMAGVNETTKKGNKLQDSMFKGVVKGAAAFSILVTAFRRVNQALTSMISSFTEFEFIMAKVRAVSGATNDEFVKLEKSAAELGRTTFFTASQVAELQLNFSKLGFTTQEILDAQEATINLSVATGSDLARAAIVAGSAIRGFGLDASEATRVVDVMAVAFTSSALDIEKFQTSMTKVAPIAAAAGFSIEETTAIMSKLSDTGIEASIAGTSLRNIFLKLQDPTSKLARRFGNTVPNLEELLKGLRDMAEAGDDFQDVLGLVDVRQVAAFQTMVNGAEDVAILAEQLRDSAGAGQTMADVVGDTTQGAILKVKSAIEGFSIALVKNFGDSMKKTLVRFAEFLNGLVESERKIELLINRIKFLGKAIVSTFIGFKMFGVFASTASATTSLFTRSVTAATVAVKTFGRALTAFGIGIAVLSLIEYISSFIKFKNEVEEAVTAQERLNKAITEGEEDINKVNIQTKKIS